MGKDDSGYVGMVDKLIHETDTCIVDYDNRIVAFVGNLDNGYR